MLLIKELKAKYSVSSWNWSQKKELKLMFIPSALLSSNTPVRCRAYWGFFL